MANPPNPSDFQPLKPTPGEAPPEDFFKPEAPAPKPRASDDPEEWPIDDPLPDDFDKAPQDNESKSEVRISPKSASSAYASFESNPGTAPKAGLPFAVAAPPLPGRPVPAPPEDEEDIFEINETLPEVPPASREPAVTREEAPLDFEEEEIDSPGMDPAPPVRAERQPYSRRDRLSLAGVFAILLILVGTFAGVLYANRPYADRNVVDIRPSLPMKGAVTTLTGIETDWRARRESDRVSMMDAVLPTLGRHEPTLLPEVKFTIDPAASKDGFLRFIFLDPAGAISGDVRVFKISGGKLESMGSGSEVSSSQEGLVYGSIGFLDTPSYVSYVTGNLPRWSIEVSESTDYNAKQDGWSRLGVFEIREKQ